jgi:methylthioribulose-1-phosphate dehydratase
VTKARTRRRPSSSHPPSGTLRRRLIEIGRSFDARGWVMGTSGNFSAVLSRRPLRLVMTRSGTHKGRLGARDLIEVDDRGRAAGTAGRAGIRPSAEALLHVELARRSDVAAVLHTHSVWSTMLSERHAPDGGIALESFEMLKGLEGVTTHEYRAWVPIVANDQDMVRLAARFRDVLHAHAHGILIAGHGLYTWGRTLDAAERHVEILEFLFEVIGRRSG